MGAGFEIYMHRSNESFTCKSGESILVGMMRLQRKSIPVGCRSGGCGVCKVLIKSGEYTVKKMSRAHISEDEEKQGFALACRCYPSGSLDVEVVEPIKKNDFD